MYTLPLLVNKMGGLIHSLGQSSKLHKKKGSKHINSHFSTHHCYSKFQEVWRKCAYGNTDNNKPVQGDEDPQQGSHYMFPSSARLQFV